MTQHKGPALQAAEAHLRAIPESAGTSREWPALSRLGAIKFWGVVGLGVLAIVSAAVLTVWALVP